MPADQYLQLLATRAGELPPSRIPELAALAAAVASPIAAHRSLGRIGGYGLGRVEGGLRLHRLTQAVLRDQLTTEETVVYRAHAEALLVGADPGHGRGDLRPARELAEQMHRAWRDALGPDDPHTLRIATVLVGILADLGPYHRARQLGEDTSPDPGRRSA